MHQQYKMKQQRICEKQEIEQQKRLDEQKIKQQINEQKAKDKAFACCRYLEKFSSNTKLYKHIIAHYTKPPLSALAMLLFSSSVPPTLFTTPKLAISTLHQTLFFFFSKLAISAASSMPLSPPASTFFS